MSEEHDKSSLDTHEAVLEYRFQGFRLDARQRRVTDPDDRPVNLSSRAFDTLLTLLRHRGETLSKSELMQQVWPNVIVEENNLNQAISSLRKALGDSRNETRFVLTVPGRGYCFIAPVEVIVEASGTALDAGANTDEVSLREAESPPWSPAGWSRQTRTVLAATALLFVLAVSAAYMLRSMPPPQGDGGASFTTDTAAPSTPDPFIGLPVEELINNSVAVLPFSSLNATPENSPFTVGLHDEIISQLAKIRSLKVISRDSIIALSRRQLPLQELGRVLKVETVMSGTVLYAGKQARISLQLLDPRSGLTLWADTYEVDQRDLSEMISVQSDIASHVAGALETEITAAEQEDIAALPTQSFEAYRYNLAARFAYFQMDYPKTWELARQAIEHDPGYFDAHYTFSTVNTVMVSTPLPGMSSREHFDLGLASAEKIIEIAPERSDGYALKAVALNAQKEWHGVASTLDTLMNMGFPLSELKYVALVLLCLGEFDKAIEIYEANLVTEPLNSYGRGFLMAAYEMAGMREKSRETYAIGEELSPVWWGDTVNVFLALGRNEALSDIEEIYGISDDLRHLLLNVHDTELVKRGVSRYAAGAGKTPVESLYYAALAARSDEHELAVQLLRASLQDVWTSLFWVWLPVFDETRRLDSFKNLLNESGLPGFWRTRGWPKVCQPAGAGFDCTWQSFPG